MGDTSPTPMDTTAPASSPIKESKPSETASAAPQSKVRDADAAASGAKAKKKDAAVADTDVKPDAKVEPAKAAAKGAKRQKVDYTGVPAEQLPIRPYLEQTVAPLLMEGMQALVKARPDRPVAWLADWLTKHDPEAPSQEEGVEAAAQAATGGVSAPSADKDTSKSPALPADDLKETVKKDIPAEENTKAVGAGGKNGQVDGS